MVRNRIFNKNDIQEIVKNPDKKWEDINIYLSGSNVEIIQYDEFVSEINEQYLYYFNKIFDSIDDRIKYHGIDIFIDLRKIKKKEIGDKIYLLLNFLQLYGNDIIKNFEKFLYIKDDILEKSKTVDLRNMICYKVFNDPLWKINHPDEDYDNKIRYCFFDEDNIKSGLNTPDFNAVLDKI